MAEAEYRVCVCPRADGLHGALHNHKALSPPLFSLSVRHHCVWLCILTNDNSMESTFLLLLLRVFVHSHFRTK